MTNHKGPLSVVIAVPLLLFGCAAPGAATDAATRVQARPTSTTPKPSASPSTTMSPGMSMAPGQSMPGVTPTAGAGQADSLANAAPPPKSVHMICGPETRRNVATLLAQHPLPPPKGVWADHLYRCSYQLPAGPLILSVKQSADGPTARSYFNAMRARLGHTRSLTGLAGLGLPAYESATGTVVFLKENMTLKVDASALPAKVGPSHTPRADAAYTIATDVLACWSE